jgi:hypothetical protein
MRPSLSVSVGPRRVLVVLVAIILTIVVFSVAGQYSAHMLGHGRLLGFVHGFDVNGEGNVPAHVSALMLLSVSLLAGLIGSWVRRADGLFYRHWVGLALIFVVLATDELNSFHERLNAPMKAFVEADGLLFFAWVVPGMAVVALFGLAYARFLWHLPGRWKKLFVVSGLVFVSGAIGVESIGGWYVSHYDATTFIGAARFTYTLITTVEEALEMIGTAIFIYALLEYLRVHVGAIHASFDGDPQERASAPSARRTPAETIA